MNTLEYLKKRLSELTNCSIGENPDLEQEINFLTEKIAKLEGLENNISKLNVDFTYTLGLPNYSSVKISQGIEIDVDGDFDLTQLHLYDVIRENVRKQIINIKKSKGVG